MIESEHNKSGPGGATNTVIQGLTAERKRLMQDSTPQAPGDKSRLSAWHGLDVDPFGGA